MGEACLRMEARLSFEWGSGQKGGRLAGKSGGKEALI